jgi:hypothetical protein
LRPGEVRRTEDRKVWNSGKIDEEGYGLK